MHIFHVHTYRCGHASNEKDELYIEKALELGASKITFTDHAPFPGDPFTGRMLYSQLSEYISSLKTLKNKYKDRIEVCIGLEIEYLQSFKYYYEELKANDDIECLILGQHHCELEDGSWSFQHNNIGKMASQVGAVQTGYFDVVAHPDRYMMLDEKVLAKKLIDECITRGILLEQNLATKMKMDFWELVPKGAKTIIGCDAHAVSELR